MQRHSRFRPYVFCIFALLLVGSPLLRAHTTTVGPRAAAEATHSLPFKLHGTATLAFTPVLDSNGQPTGKLLGHSLAPESGTATYLGHWTADVPDFVLTPIIYDGLLRLAKARLNREYGECTLLPNDLVHESYMRLADQTRLEWQNRAHFCAIAATTMRRVLIDHARTRKAEA